MNTVFFSFVGEIILVLSTIYFHKKKYGGRSIALKLLYYYFVVKINIRTALSTFFLVTEMALRVIFVVPAISVR